MKTAGLDVSPGTATDSTAPSLDRNDPAFKACQSAIDAFRAANGQDAHVERLITPLPHSETNEFILAAARVPTNPETLMVKAKQVDADPTVRASANRHLVNLVLIYPTGPELTAVLKRYPVMVDTWAGEIMEMSGNIRGTRREKA